MLYDPNYLIEQYKDNSDGLSEEEFIKDRANQLLDIWIEQESGQELYKNIGPYFEVFYPILKKYVPEKLTEYEKKVKQIDFFNEEVKKEYDYNSDIINFIASLSYLEEANLSNHFTQDVHYILLNNNTVPYMPNSNIDINQYLGRDKENL